MTFLKIGDKAPEFKTKDETGEIISSATLKGKKYILFFYPKDDSPGCTKEACSVRDKYKNITKHGYEIFGVSPDSAKRHLKFIDKYDLQYRLLTDPDKIVINSFGVWGPKKFMGREIVGVYRTSFLIDEHGVISNIITKVKTKDHGQQILDSISEISLDN